MIMDIPNYRSSHSTPTPRGGGLAIVLIWLIAISYLFFNDDIEKKLYFAFLAGLPLVIIGILDDIFSLSSKLRFVIQGVSSLAGLLLIKGLQVFEIANLEINGTVILSLFACFFILWCINLFNFLDGIDGYISMEIIFLSLSLFFFTSADYLILLAIATFGFIIFNWQPAKIFMGDVGSTYLGYIMAISAIHFQNQQSLSLITWMILASVFLFDATFTIIKRFMNKEKLDEPHRKHAYQRLVISGFSHQKTVLVVLAFNIVLFGLAFLSYNFEKFAYIPFLVALILNYLAYEWVGKKEAFN
jgi:Fuc2NAc and GlcNAc transferase